MTYLSLVGGSRGLVVKVLDSKFEGCEFKTHTGHGSFSKLRQFRLPYFASVYSAANEYKHCLEGTCDGLVVKVLDSKFEGCEFKTHTGHGSFSKLRQFRLPYFHFASVYSAANEYKHCLEGTCDGLVSRPGESV